MAIEDTITTLSNSHQPVKTRRLTALFGQTLVMLVMCFALITSFYGLRPDLLTQWQNPAFMVEIFANIALIILTAYGSCLCAYPDRNYSPYINVAILMALMGYLVFFATQLEADHISSHTAFGSHKGMHCFLCILSFAALPALFMIWKLRKMAPVRLRKIALSLAFMSCATGMLGVRIVTQEEINLTHAAWHLAPILLGLSLAFFLGKKIFRW